MKKLGRIAAAFMASVFFLTGIPAMTAFAADEIPAAEEVVTETPAEEIVTETPAPETPASETPAPETPVVVETPSEPEVTVEPEAVVDAEDTVTSEEDVLGKDGNEENLLKNENPDGLLKAAAAGIQKEGDDNSEQEPTRATASKIPYDGDTVAVIRDDGTTFSTWTPPLASEAVINGNDVVISYTPKALNRFNAIHWGTPTDDPMTVDVAANAEGTFEITLSKDNCGYGIPIAVLRPAGTASDTQYYLAIPAEDKLVHKVAKIPYDGDAVKIIKEDGSEFASWAPQEGTDAVLDGNNVVVTYVPKGLTRYDAIHWGAPTDDPLTKDVSANAEGKFEITLSKDNCGYGIPIAVLRLAGTALDTQYYLAIPSEDKINGGGSDEPDDPVDPEPTDLVIKTNAKVELVEGKMFNVVACMVTKNADGTYDAIMAMSGDGYDKLYQGTAEDAETDVENQISYVIDSQGRYAFILKNVPIDEDYHIAAHGSKWYDRTIKITLVDPDSEEANPKPTPTPTNDGKAEQESAHTTDLSGATSAVDNSTSLADGVYTPDKFSFSGGSGRGSFTCTKVTVTDGKAYATLVFSSNNYQYVKASGNIYYCDHSTGLSTVTIPVALNQNNTIVAMTTAMSAAHEITYTMFVYIAGADAQQGGALSSNEELDKEAPVIPGLKFESEEKLEYAENFKIFNYSDGIRLLEIDMRLRDDKDDAKKDDGKSSTQIDETTKKNAVLHDDEDSLIDTQEVPLDEADNDGITTTADAQAELYKGNVIKYLLVPENVEIPAGLEKEVIVINLPVESVYSGSDEISEIFKELKIEDLITSQVEEDKDNKDIVAAGDYKDLDLKALIKSKCDLVILPEDSIEAEDVKDEKAQKEAKENFEQLAEDLANLDVPVLVDRADYEETDNAKAEWIKVFGILFNCEKEANALFETMTK